MRVAPPSVSCPGTAVSCGRYVGDTSGMGLGYRSTSTYWHVKKPWRHAPDDFREMFLEMGWDGLEEHYRTTWRTIRRWIDDCGGEQLRLDRRAVVKARGPRRLHGYTVRRVGKRNTG